MKAIPGARDIPMRYFAFEASSQSLGPGPGSSSCVPLLYHYKVNMYSRIENPHHRDILTGNGIGFTNKC